MAVSGLLRLWVYIWLSAAVVPVKGPFFGVWCVMVRLLPGKLYKLDLTR